MSKTQAELVDTRTKCLSVIEELKIDLENAMDRWLSIADLLGDNYEAALKENKAAFQAVKARKDSEEQLMVAALAVMGVTAIGFAAVPVAAVIESKANPVNLSVQGILNKSKWISSNKATFKTISTYSGALEDGVQQAWGAASTPIGKKLQVGAISEKMSTVSVAPTGKSYATGLKIYLREQMEEARNHLKGLLASIREMELKTFEVVDDRTLERNLNTWKEQQLLSRNNNFRSWRWSDIKKSFRQGMYAVWVVTGDSTSAPPPEVLADMHSLDMLVRANIDVNSLKTWSLIGPDQFIMPVHSEAWRQLRAWCMTWQPSTELGKMAALLPTATDL